MSSLTAAAVIRALRAASSPQKARSSAWFFKTGPGEYGYGDKFLGLTVPAMRRIGLGLLAVPVLSASASYAISEGLNWKEGLNLKLKRAHGFYA